MTEIVAHLVPPRLVVRPHRLHDIGVLIGDIPRLPGVGIEVVQFGIIHQPPAVPNHRGIAMARGSVARWHEVPVLHDEHSVCQLVFPAQKAAQGNPVKSRVFGRVQAAQGNQGRQHVRAVRGTGNVARVAQRPIGPTHEKRHPMPALVQRGLFAAHARVVHGLARCSAIIGHENQQGIVAQPGFCENRIQLAHVLVDIRDHPVKTGDIVRHLREVGLAILVGHPQRGMGRVGGDVREKRRVAPRFDPVYRLVEPHIRAIPFKRL